MLEDEQRSENADEYFPNSTTYDGTAVDEFGASPSRRGIAEVDDSSYSSLEHKLEQQKANAIQNTGMTEAELNAARYVGYKSFYDPQGSAGAMTDLHEQLTTLFGAEEADFRFAVINAGSDWGEVRRLIRERESLLGTPHQYDALLLETGISSGEISAEEVATIVQRGTAILPDNVVFRMASNGSIEAIKGLADRGLLGNPNYEHPTLSINAVGAFIRHASLYPDKYDSSLAQAQLSALIDIGIEIQPTSGALDPLDLALRRTHRDNASVKYAIVKTLIQRGVRVEESHRQLLQQMPDGAAKDRLEKLLANHL